MRVHMLPEEVISRCLKYLHEEGKAPWDLHTASLAAENGHLHILEYLVERKFDKYSECVWQCSHERPLGLFEVLARNRQSAVGRLERILRTHRQPPRMFTIPPRQQLSSPIMRLAIRGRNFTHLIINTHTKREKERERKRNTKPSLRIIKSDSAFFIRQ